LNTTSHAKESTPPLIQWVSEAVSLVERPDRQVDHLHPSSAELNKACNYTSTPPIRLHGVVLS